MDLKKKKNIQKEKFEKTCMLLIIEIFTLIQNGATCLRI